MKIVDRLLAVAPHNGFIVYQPEDILYIIQTLTGFPQQEQDGHLEELDLENYGFVEISENKIHFFGGGDWQKPMEVVLEFIDNKFVFTKAEIITNIEILYGKQLDDDIVCELMDLPPL